MNDSWVNVLDHGWLLSVSKPEDSPSNPPLILLHGMSGNENSVKSLILNVKRNRWILAFRGMLQAEDQGYAWAPARARDRQGFTPSIQALAQEWPNLQSLLAIDSKEVDLLGFSQGAAFASLLLLTYPNWIRRTAIASGFIPQIETAFVAPKLTGHQVWVSHGTQDDVIPFAEAESSVQLLTSLGAEVTFCQSNTRHKIGSNCLKQLEIFFD